jgi:hypothetical protein
VRKIQISTQICTKCHLKLPIENFGKDKRYTNLNGGYSKYCKTCRHKMDAARYSMNAPEILEKRKQRYHKIKWVIKNCPWPRCNARISVKTKPGKYYCQECGKPFCVSETLGGENGITKRANTHGIRLTPIKQSTAK